MIVVLFEEANGEQMTKCKQTNDVGITVNSAFTPSMNVLTAANKARGMRYFIKRSSFYPYIERWLDLILNTPSKPTVPTSKKTCHLEKIQRAATRWVKGHRDLRLKVLKL